MLEVLGTVLDVVQLILNIALIIVILRWKKELNRES